MSRSSSQFDCPKDGEHTCLYVLHGPWAVEPDDLRFEWRHLMREAITGHQRSSEVLGCPSG